MNQNSNRRMGLRVIAAIIGLALIIVAIYLIMSGVERQFSVKPAENGSRLTHITKMPVTVEEKGVEYKLKDGVTTFLLMGIDTFGKVEKSNSYNNSNQADVLTLFVFDDETKTCNVVSINRDTMANVPVLSLQGHKLDSVYAQIALAHTYGKGLEDSCQNVADAVSDLFLNISIDDYISVNMDGVGILNDMVGGVTVTIVDDFSAVDPTLKMGETVTLLGEHALTYVRSRGEMLEPTNVARMERQKAYMTAFTKKLQETAKSDSLFVVKAFDAISDYTVTDSSAGELSKLSEKLSGYTIGSFLSPSGRVSEDAEFIEFYPDEESINEIVLNLFYEKSE